MSWEPDTPVGFSACGHAFGAVRKPYSAACKFYADDIALDNRINWYIVPDNTPLYEGPTPFWPRVDVPPDKALTVHEREGQGRFVRTFDWGLVFIPPPAHAPHGDEQDFAGEAPRSKHWIDGIEPEAPCVVIRVNQMQFAIKARLVKPGEVFTTAAGVQLGGELRYPPLYPITYPAAVALGGELVLPSPIMTAGISIGGDGVSMIFYPGILLGGEALPFIAKPPHHGIDVGGVMVGGVLVVPVGPPPLPGVVLGAMQVGGELRPVAPDVDFGVEVGGETVTPGEDVECGIAIDGHAVPDGVDVGFAFSIGGSLV